MSKGLEAFKNIMKIYGETNSLAGTYDSFLKIKKELERLEELEKAQDIEISNLKFTDNESKYQTSIRVLKEAFIVLGRGDIANTCWFKYLEELEKENQELREDKKVLIKNADCCMWKDCINITKENEKLKKENQELKELVESLHKEQIIQAERIFDLEIENTKLKEVIKFLGEQLGLDVDLENHNLITDDGTIAFVNADEETMSVLELLKEVIG